MNRIKQGGDVVGDPEIVAVHECTTETDAAHLVAVYRRTGYRCRKPYRRRIRVAGFVLDRWIVIARWPEERGGEP